MKFIVLTHYFNDKPVCAWAWIDEEHRKDKETRNYHKWVRIKRKER